MLSRNQRSQSLCSAVPLSTLHCTACSQGGFALLRLAAACPLLKHKVLLSALLQQRRQCALLNSLTRVAGLACCHPALPKQLSCVSDPRMTECYIEDTLIVCTCQFGNSEKHSTYCWPCSLRCRILVVRNTGLRSTAALIAVHCNRRSCAQGKHSAGGLQWGKRCSSGSRTSA